jgi:hypothetical protein
MTKQKLTMMKSKNIFMIAAIAIIVAVSCNPVRRTTNMLVGDWQITNFEEQVGVNQGVVATNVGTITLNEDRTGKRMFSYSIMGLSTNDTTNFRWTNTENSILIDATQADHAKLWIIKELKRNSQVWITTDGKASMQTMTLKKIKD